MKLYARGKVLGVAEKEDVNQKSGEVFSKAVLILQSAKNGGLPGQTEDSEYLLTKRQIENGCVKRLDEYKGKDILIEVFGNHRGSKKLDDTRVWSNWYLSGEAVPQVVSK
jgi:hypothetical protein